MNSESYGQVPETGYHSRKTSNEDQKGLAKRKNIMQQLDVQEFVYLQTKSIEQSAENDLLFSCKDYGSAINKNSAFVEGKVENLYADQITDEDSQSRQSRLSLQSTDNQFKEIISNRPNTRTRRVDSFSEMQMIGFGQANQMQIISDYLQGSSSGQLNGQETQNFGEAVHQNSVIYEEQNTYDNYSNPYSECEDPRQMPQQYQNQVENDAKHKNQMNESTPLQNIFQESLIFSGSQLISLHPDAKSQKINAEEMDFEPLQAACQLVVWGSNFKGQLGLGERMMGEIFRFPIKLGFQQEVLKVSCGFEHTAIITTQQMLYMMGSNIHGQLGIGFYNTQIGTSELNENTKNCSVKFCSQPSLVDQISHLQVIDVSCGGKHTICIAQEHQNHQQRILSVFTWGDNTKGQLGKFEQTNDNILLGNGLPSKIEFKMGSQVDDIVKRQGIKIDKISAGHEHSVFLDTQHSLIFACGEARFGQLGLGKQISIIKEPQLIDVLLDKNIVQIAAGRNHTLAQTSEGFVYASGLNSSGQLGMGHQETLQMFQQIPKLKNVVKIAASSYSAAIDCEGKLFVWGFWGTSHSSEPRQLKSQSNLQFESLSIGDGFGVVLNKQGRVYAWGSNELGQLGTGFSNADSQQNEIAEVQVLSEKGTAQDVFAGQNFVIAKMVEVYPSFTDEYSSVSLSQLNEAKQKAKFAKQVMQIVNLRDDQNQSHHSNISKNLKVSQNNTQNEYSSQQWIKSPGMQEKASSSIFQAQVQDIHTRTQTDLKKNYEGDSSPKYQAQHSIATTSTRYTQYAQHPLHIHEKIQEFNLQNQIHQETQQRFEPRNPLHESQKVDNQQNVIRNDFHEKFTGLIIQSDQQQRTDKQSEYQKLDIWNSFGKPIDEQEDQVFQRQQYDPQANQEEIFPVLQKTKTQLITEARSKSSQPQRSYKPRNIVQNFSQIAKQGNHFIPTQTQDLASNKDLRQEKKEQKERKRKQIELERKFSQMQKEYFENKVRREQELQKVYMNSYKGLSLSASNQLQSTENLNQREKENIRPNQNHSLAKSYDKNNRQFLNAQNQDFILVNQKNFVPLDQKFRARSMPRPSTQQIGFREIKQPLQQLYPVQTLNNEQPKIFYEEQIVVDRLQANQITSDCNTSGTNTSSKLTLETPYPTTSGRSFHFIPQDQQNNHHQMVGQRMLKKNYDSNYVQKLRRKYKKLKFESKNKTFKMQEQTQQIEQFRVLITDLQNQVSLRKQAWHKKLKDREDQHNKTTRQMRADINVLQEQLLTAERMYQHKESETKIANQKLNDMGEQVFFVEGDLQNLREQLYRMQASNEQLKVDNEGFVKKVMEKDHHIRELKQHMDVRTMCIAEAESTIKEQSKGMKKMQIYLQEAQVQVEIKDESVKQYAKQIEILLEEQNNLKRQLEQLKAFIHELETNNMELLRFYDNKNFKEAEDYRNRAQNLFNASKDEVNKCSNTGNNSLLDSTFRTNRIDRKLNSKSFSPVLNSEYLPQLTNQNKELLDFGNRTLKRVEGKQEQREYQPPQMLTATAYDSLTQREKEPQENLPQYKMPSKSATMKSAQIKQNHNISVNESEKSLTFEQLPQRGKTLKTETAQIVDRAEKMIEKLLTLNKKLGNRPLIYQEESQQPEFLNLTQQSKSYQPSLYHQEQPLQKSFDNQRITSKKDTEVGWQQFANLHASKNTVNPFTAVTRSKSYEDQSNSEYTSKQQWDQVNHISRNTNQTQSIGNGLCRPNMIHLQSEPEMQSYKNESGQGIRFKTATIPVQQHFAQTNSQDEQEYTDAQQIFPSVSKNFMRKELETINSTLAQMKKERFELDSSIARYQGNLRY